MDASTMEEVVARNAIAWETVERDMERLAEQVCDELHGEIGTFQAFSDDQDRLKWRELAWYLWGLGARPAAAP